MDKWGGVNLPSKNKPYKSNLSKLLKLFSVSFLIFSIFVGSNVFAVTVEEFQRIASDKTAFENFQIQLVKKYKAKNWNDLLYNKQTTDMDAEDVEVIKFILKKQEDIRIISNLPIK